MAISLFTAIAILIKPTPFFWGFGLGGVVIMFVGLLDDKISIPPIMKFGGEIVAVLIFIKVSGCQLTNFGDLLGFGNIKFGSLSMIITVFAMVGLINSLNLSDGLDGLAAGISLISCLFFMPLAFISQQWGLLGFSVILLGMLLGFLRYNTYPARLFMGDTGSLLLGFSLGCLAIAIIQPHVPGVQVKPIDVFWILSLPVVDTICVMSSRILQGANPFHPDNLHLHHRLLARRFSHSTVVTTIYGFMFILGITGQAIRPWPEYLQFYLTTSGYIALYLGLYILEKRNFTPQARKKSLVSNSDYTPSTLRRNITTMIGKSNKAAPYLIAVVMVAPALFSPSTTRAFGFFSFAIVIFVSTLFPWRDGKKSAGLAHALIFLSLFGLTFLYLLNPNHPTWMISYMITVSFILFVWVLCRVTYRRRYQVILPTSFELLLIVISWFIPLVWSKILHIDQQTESLLILACALVVPILAGTKATIRRQPRRNRQLVLCLQAALFITGIKAFW